MRKVDNTNKTFCFVDTVSNTVQSVMDTTQKIAHSAVDTGSYYATSAKGNISELNLIKVHILSCIGCKNN